MTVQRRCGVCGFRHSPRCEVTDAHWPVADLVAAVGGPKNLSRLLGWTDRGFYGDLSDTQADRYAIRCGLHPEQVWPGWCEAALTVSDDLFVNGGGWRQAWEWAEEQRRNEATETAA